MAESSLIRSSLHAFFRAFFTIFGLVIGLIVAVALLSYNGTSTETDTESEYKAKVYPNGNEVRKTLSKDAPIILKLNIQGLIGTETLDMDTIRTQLLESREGSFKNNRVKAILLHIQTPGGTVVDADGIYRALKHYKAKYQVPIYAYVDGLCASGGMYVACAADKVYASEVSLVGSVGVIAPSFINVVELLDKIGVKSLTIFAGKGKDDLNPMRPWREDEDKNYREIIGDYYQMFVDIVASNRPIDKQQLIDTYGARVFPANQAKEYGYVDEINNQMSEVIQTLATQIGIQDDYYQVVELEKSSWYKELFSSKLSLLKGQMNHEIKLPGNLRPEFFNQYLYLYQP